jgi:ATP-dependent DNA helicase RecG
MLCDLKGVGAVTEKKLNELGVYCEKDLVERLPRSYTDFSDPVPLEKTADGQFCLFDAKVEKISGRFRKKNLSVFKINAKNINGTAISVVWYNLGFVSKIIEIGKIYTFYGKVHFGKKCYEFVNPMFEEKTDKSQFCGIKPIYCTKGLIPQKTYAKIVNEALEHNFTHSLISGETEKKYGLENYSSAVCYLHNPPCADVSEYRNRIATEKLVKRICAYRIAQNEQISAKKRRYDAAVNFEAFEEKLPFAPNASQKAAVKKIIGALRSPSRLNAILTGDVGSGKTAVAAAAVYFAAECGWQSAVLAPTEILARQHYVFFDSVMKPLGIKTCFLSSSVSKSDKQNIYFSLKNCEYDVVIGTHALLNESLILPKLGFVVEDEQQRFGVAQRTGLIAKGEAVDVLTLSATPIPRSLQLAAYGETEFITLERRFDTTVKTAIVGPGKREDMWRYVAEECEKGNKAYIVAPSIFDAEGIETESVESLFTEVCGYMNREYVGVMHGRLCSDAKESVMEKFRSGAYRALVSTSVVEVGVDVPDAGIIVIAGAERFGLSTLHQLRGRVGRKGQKAYCFLYTEKEPSEGLKTLCYCSDGFEIAEKDFETRGAGEVFGLEQSGAGTLGKITFGALKTAEKIAAEVDLKAAEPSLLSEIESFSLGNVSLN